MIAEHHSNAQDQRPEGTPQRTVDRPARPIAPAGVNPFVMAPEEEEAGPDPIDNDPVLGTAASLLGRTGHEEFMAGTGLWLVGAAGGVGVSTLAAACGAHVHDSAHSEPPWGSPVVVWHDQTLIHSFICFKCNFPFIPLPDPNLMITTLEVYL